jgi:hypothetical protein
MSSSHFCWLRVASCECLNKLTNTVIEFCFNCNFTFNFIFTGPVD